MILIKGLSDFLKSESKGLNLSSLGYLMGWASKIRILRLLTTALLDSSCWVLTLSYFLSKLRSFIFTTRSSSLNLDFWRLL